MLPIWVVDTAVSSSNMLLVKDHPLDGARSEPRTHSIKKRVSANITRDAQLLVKVFRKVDNRRAIVVATRGDLLDPETRVRDLALNARLRAMKKKQKKKAKAA